MDITIENLKRVETFMECLEERCEDIIRWKKENDPNGLVYTPPISGYLHDFQFDSENERICFTVTEMAGLSDGDSDGMSIPYLELVNDDWKEVFIQQLNEQKQKIEKKNERIKIESEKWERDMYEKLKQKFEGENE